MDSACRQRFESGTFTKPDIAESTQKVLERLDVLDRRLASDVAAAQATSPAAGLVLACLRLQLLSAAERLLAMVARQSGDPQALAAAHTLLVAYESAITDATSARIRASGTRAA